MMTPHGSNSSPWAGNQNSIGKNGMNSGQQFGINEHLNSVNNVRNMGLNSSGKASSKN